MPDTTPSDTKLVNAGGLRAPLAELIERLAMFGFPPQTSPEYAAAIDRECAKLLRKFPDAESWTAALISGGGERWGYSTDVVDPPALDAMGDDGLLLGQDTTSQAGTSDE